MSEINDDAMKTNGSKVIGDCNYHLCDKKGVEIHTCPYCSKHFCADHKNPVEPMEPHFEDSKLFAKWKEAGDNHHPCPDYWEYQQKKEKEARISHSIDSLPRGRVSYRIYKKSPNYGHIRNETPKPVKMEQQTSETTKSIDKPYFVRSDNRSMSFEKPLPQIEKNATDYNTSRSRPNYLFTLKNSFRNVRWTNTQILLVLILATVITNIIGMVLLKGEIFGFPKLLCPLTSLLGIFVTVIGIMSSVQSNRNYVKWDRSEARWVRQWTKGVQSEQDFHNFNIGMSAAVMGIGMGMMFLPLIVLLETIGGTILFILNLIYAGGLIFLLRKYFRFR